MTTLTRRQTEHLRRMMLTQRKKRLGEAHEELLRSGDERFADLAGEVPDLGDQSVAALLGDLDHALLNRHIEAIRGIDDSLLRIDEGRFGKCIDCGDEIEFERLAAFPTAERCATCQRRREKTFVHEGTPTL